MTRRLVFTVDLDRDVNIPEPGVSRAGSIDRGEGTSPRFSSSERGLARLLDLLDDIGVRATFFTEGRTAETVDVSGVSGHCIGLHGYDHEDLTGKETSVEYTDSEVHDLLKKGYIAVKDNVGVPTCFRAPYMSADDSVLREVSDLGIRHDSSVYSALGEQPYETVHGMTEHPVPKTRDARGKNMAAYLWPMHEGRRSPDDYIWMASQLEDGDLVLATHSWHMVESRERGLMDGPESERNSDNVRRVIEGILDLGYTPSTIC